MRSRSGLDLAGLALAAAVDGVWCGALAAVLTGASWIPSTAFAFAVVVVAGYGARQNSGAERERIACIVAVAVVLVATGVLFCAGQSWAHPYVVWHGGRDVVFVSMLVVLGIRVGRAVVSPEEAMWRAVRAFGLLCAMLVCAAAAGATPSWGAWVIVASVVVGGLFIAVVRYRDLTDAVNDADRLPAWPWLAAVAAALLGIIAVGLLLTHVVSPNVLRWVLETLAAGLSYALASVAFVIGWAGAWLLRGAEHMFTLFHLHAAGSKSIESLVAEPSYVPATSTADLDTLRVVLMIGAAVAAVATSLAIVAVALRRSRREPPDQEAVEEEHETLTSPRSAALKRAAAIGRLLRRRLMTLRQTPSCPAEIVRHRYAQLERRLARADLPRLPGVTVRAHLAAVATVVAVSPAKGTADGWPVPGELAQPAADLAAIYELARYSDQALDASQAARFEALARAFSRLGGEYRRRPKRREVTRSQLSPARPAPLTQDSLQLGLAVPHHEVVDLSLPSGVSPSRPPCGR